VPNPTRRSFLTTTAAAAGALLLDPHFIAPIALAESTSSTQPAADPYISCFYQFSRDSLASLSGADGLPNGAQYLHIFSASHASHAPHPEVARNVHACGQSFKYARAIDIWKYQNWETANDDQLRQWAIEFRDEALPADGPADYFAFNEMPAGAESKPDLQARIARWMRFLHDPKDGRPAFRAVFYLVEENLNPATWKGNATDELWSAIDDTSDLVVGEHYHDQKFLADHTAQQLTDHLFALPQWLDASGKPAQQNIARHKYAVLHSTYYGPAVTNWQGMQQSTSTPAQFKGYLQALIAATRRNPLGQSRIAFGPLYTSEIDEADLLAALTGLLAANAPQLLALGQATPEEEAPLINATIAEIAFNIAEAMLFERLKYADQERVDAEGRVDG